MQAADKKALRQRLLIERQAIDVSEKQRLDAALCAKIGAHPRFLKADALLGYLPMRGEPDLTALFQAAKTLHISVYLPRCTEDGMRFLRYTDHNSLTRDRFGILAPDSDADEAVLTAHTLCLVPGIAAGRDGSRLGYGGGFYDRFLPRFMGYSLFALYHRFVFDTLPHQSHDYRLAHIITEKGEL